MTSEPEPHVCSPSHTSSAEAAKIKRRPQGHVAAARSASLLPWNIRKPVTVRLKYRGGAEGFVEVRGRGRTWRYPGCTPIHDVLLDFLGHERWNGQATILGTEEPLR